MNLTQVGQLAENRLVAERDVDQAVVSKGAHGSKGSRLLATAQGGGRDEETGILAPVATGGPDAAGLVPESLPLGGEVTVASGDTDEDGIVFEENLGFGNRVRGFGGSVHFGQDLVGEGLGDLEDIDLAAGGLNALLLGLGQFLDVAVHGILLVVSAVWWGRGGAHTKTIAILGAIAKVIGWRRDYGREGCWVEVIESKGKTWAGLYTLASTSCRCRY